MAGVPGLSRAANCFLTGQHGEVKGIVYLDDTEGSLLLTNHSEDLSSAALCQYCTISHCNALNWSADHTVGGKSLRPFLTLRLHCMCPKMSLYLGL